jgi:hypothetical protein
VLVLCAGSLCRFSVAEFVQSEAWIDFAVSRVARIPVNMSDVLMGQIRGQVERVQKKEASQLSVVVVEVWSGRKQAWQVFQFDVTQAG